MNLIKFWEGQAAKWNEIEKCGFCWKFSGVMTRSAMNKYEIRKDDCCVHLFLVNMWFNEVRTYRNPPFDAQSRCQYGFTLFAVYPTDIGLNNYDETPGHSIEESVSKSIIQPLMDCLGCGLEFDECEFNGNLFMVPQWRADVRLNVGDANWSGLEITAIFEEG